jgi:hypothetical protein
MFTVPLCARLVASGTLIQDYFTAYYTWVLANSGNFTVENEVGGPVTSFTLTHSDGWQINLRLNAGTLLGGIAPNGGITDSTNPGAAPHWSGEFQFLPTLTGTSTEQLVITYDDAIALLIKNSAGTFTSFGFHAGRIFVPDNKNDPTDYFIDGLGFFSGVPNVDVFAVSGNIWLSPDTNTQSRIRVGENIWYRVNAVSAANISGSAPTGPRPAPFTLTGANGSAGNTAPTYGQTKYYRRHNATVTTFSILPGNNSVQGYLFIRNSTTSGLMILWDRTVNP